MADEKNLPKKVSRKVKLAREFRNQLVLTSSTLITSAFALVAAFAWNDLVKEAIDKYISTGQTILSRVIYVLLVTLLAVVVSFQFGKLAASNKVEQEEEEEKEEKESTKK
jgi:uncharacterized membrane protein